MTDPHTVLLHVSSRPEDVARSIGTARTLHRSRPDHRIRIIVNGPAITGVTADATPLDLSHLPATAVIEACEVGMRAHDIVAEQLQPGVTTVASAVVALVDAQFAGAACVRI
ncbi:MULTISPECIES: DsrE family protein [unclassified Microbacterium]|uniref:DsrE family protein n=1 Tax=unclassified Microbacterium TaxID=2609290 RepID=UPI0008FC2115|nr:MULTISPECIES: hypothetical protein [unclassified Microbacterium]OIU88688.1 hypothetical protein BFN01_03690 [Microbacterium sp. AR7-10]WCD93317.1 hypothetical protein PGB26_03275 [Microbacterium sp. nov. GSS16]